MKINLLLLAWPQYNPPTLCRLHSGLYPFFCRSYKGKVQTLLKNKNKTISIEGERCIEPGYKMRNGAIGANIIENFPDGDSSSDSGCGALNGGCGIGGG